MIIGVLIVGALLFGYVIKPRLDNRMVSVVAPVTIANQELQFSFQYPSGEEGYTLIEPPIPETTASGLRKVYLIMSSPEYIAFQSSSSGAETPPSVSVFVLQRPPAAADETASRLERLQEWASQNPQFSSWLARTGGPEEVEVDGVKAWHYFTDGTYQQEVYLIGYQDNIYVFTGQYIEETDPIRSMFIDVIQSIALD